MILNKIGTSMAIAAPCSRFGLLETLYRIQLPQVSGGCDSAANPVRGGEL